MDAFSRPQTTGGMMWAPAGRAMQRRHSLRYVRAILPVLSLLLACHCESDPSAPHDPAGQASPSSLAFGEVQVGSSADLTFTLENVGGGTLSGTVSESSADFSVVGEAGYNLSAGQTATFTIRFAPASAGTKACTIETGSAECPDVSCTGTGTPGPVCQIEPTALDFGQVEVGASADLTFMLQNTGGGTLSGTVSETCGEFSVVGEAAYSLGMGESATFTISFAPASPGSKTCTVGTGSTVCFDVDCTGTGIPGPDCQAAPLRLDFGDVPTGGSAEATFTVRNTGGGTLSGTVTETCDDFSIVGNADYNLGGGQVATFSVRFAPTSVGAKACTVSTGSPDCSDVTCYATGLAAVCEVYPTVVDLGKVLVGDSRSGSFTIENVGSDTLSGTVTEACPCFSISGGPNYNLGPGESATFGVGFAPDRSGMFACGIDTGTPECGDVCFEGLGDEIYCCGVDPTSLAFGNVAVGDSLDKTFVIKNWGCMLLSGTVSEACDEFSIVGDASYSLGGEATFTVRFKPTSAGEKTCTVETGDSHCPDVNCTAAGTGGPVCDVSPPYINFTPTLVGHSKSVPVTIRNIGSDTLSGMITEACPCFHLLGSTTYSLGPGQADTVTVIFQPEVPIGYSCTIDIGSSACASFGCTGGGYEYPGAK